MPNVRVSVKQRPPTRSVASKSISLRPVAAMRRAAAIPAAPAPTMTTSMLLEAGIASVGCAATATDEARNERRLNVTMAFPTLWSAPTARRPIPQSADPIEPGRVDQPIIHRRAPSAAVGEWSGQPIGRPAKPGNNLQSGRGYPRSVHVLTQAYHRPPWRRPYLRRLSARALSLEAAVTDAASAGRGGCPRELTRSNPIFINVN